ncbi:MAG TPA: N-acetyltransferase [Chloroflexi bacterium]|nr:N-acetyltransferase [Chloroflexota bacterium]
MILVDTYLIRTPRLTLRCWNPADAPLLRAALTPETIAYLRPWLDWAWEEPRSPEETVAYLRACRGKFDLDQDYTFGIFTRDESAVLGGTGLHLRSKPYVREIGYWIRREAAGEGYATEAAAALTQVAFRFHRAARVEIHCDPENHASAAVARKLGFTHEATLRARTKRHDGRWHDAMLWTMLPEEFPASPCADLPIEVLDALGKPGRAYPSGG